MDQPEAPQTPDQPEAPKQDSGSTGDLVALGIGCLVFLIMFVAVVLVGMSER